MGFSLSSKLGVKKVARKLFGKKASRFTEWGYTKKKLGLNRIFGSPSSAQSFQNQHTSGIYGHTGSIIGKY